MTPGQVLDVIANRLRAWPVRRDPDALVIENLDLRLACRLDDACQPIGRCALISASHPALGRPHVQHCAAWGDSDVERAERAADVWLEGTFEVLHDLLCAPQKPEHVERARLVVRDDDTGELKAFSAILGPIEGARSADVPERIVPKPAFISLLVGPLSGLLVDGKLHWLRCFVGRVQGQPPAVDCWFDNDSWDKGAEALTRLRLEWGEPPGYEAFRQSVIFKPAPLDEVPDSLIAALPKPE